MEEASDVDPSLEGSDWSPDRTGIARKILRKTIPVELRVRIRMALLDTPVVSPAYTKLDKKSRVAHVSRHTPLVIDAPARSGSSYARAAFLYANGFDFPVASHRHSHQLILRGVRLKRPTILLLRDPKSVLTSSLNFEPEVSPLRLIQAYVCYFEAVIPVIDHVVIAPFEQVTSDFGQIIRECNDRFGTHFIPYENTPKAEKEVAAYIDNVTKKIVGPDAFDAIVPLPSTHRVSGESRLRSLDAKALSEMGRATALHAEFLIRSGFSAKST